MSDPHGTYWGAGAGVYSQPLVVNPPSGQNPHNARHAIWHLGRVIEIEVYPSGAGYRVGNGDPVDDGRHDRGAPRVLAVHGVIQPEKAGSITLTAGAEGEGSEGRMILHLDSHQPENIVAAQANADIFPDGIRLIGPDMDAADDQRNTMTIIRFRGRRWKILSVAEHWEGGDDELHPAGAVYRAVLGLFQDRNQERDAKPGMTSPAWGPE